MSAGRTSQPFVGLLPTMAELGRLLGSAAVAAVLLALLGTGTGCSRATPSTLTADEAWSRYGPLMAEAEAALRDGYPDVAWDREEPRVGPAVGGQGPCTLMPGRVLADVALTGTDPGLDHARQMLDPILTGHGFRALSLEATEDDRHAQTTYESRTGDEKELLTLTSSVERSRTILDPGFVVLDDDECPADFSPPPADG